MGLEWKLTFSSPVATAEFSKFVGILRAALLQHHLLEGIDLDYCDVEWFALEMNWDHPVIFERAPKYCISDSVDYEGYSN